jgi:hypothetical protein
MDFIKKILNPASIPFYKKQGNVKYAELIKFTELPKCEKFITKRIIQEIRQNDKIVVSALDCNLNYIFIDKYGRINEFIISENRFTKSTKLLFDRCNKSLSQIIELEAAEKEFLSTNGIRLTFLTDKGNFSLSGDLDDMAKRKITGQVIAHLSNLTYLHNPKKYDRLMKREFEKIKNSR